MEIRPLAREDVPAAVELSRQAGWNQVPADWHRLLDLAPGGCFGGRIDGDLVATATLVTYGGAVGWIGMVLVAEAHRRNGYGTAMFEHVLEVAGRRGVTVGLDATDAGRELYRRAGFVDVRPVERWVGEISPAVVAGDDAPTARPLGTDELPVVRSLDRWACGVDRGDLLAHLLSADDTVGLAVGAGPRGYAVVRPGRERDHVGPVIAQSDADAAALLAAAADAVDGSVLIDVLAVDRMGDRFERVELERWRKLTRMTVPESGHPEREPSRLLARTDVVAAAGYELG